MQAIWRSSTPEDGFLRRGAPKKWTELWLIVFTATELFFIFFVSPIKHRGVVGLLLLLLLL